MVRLSPGARSPYVLSLEERPVDTSRFDALVVGSGPAGSVAATVLARGGARVALVDKARFPRDKACGDLVGPRGVQLLEDLGIRVAGTVPIGDMVVVGPTARRVRLPCFAGHTYPGYALSLPRAELDAALHDAAVAAGAESFVGRAATPLFGDSGLEGFTLDTGIELRADVVIGADGATSGVAAAAELVDSDRVLWGFAVRAYIDAPVDAPHIVLWEPSPWRAYPGYGWLFPGPDGRANLGLGLGTLSTRTGGASAARELPAFTRTLRELGLLDAATPGPILGGWLKLGMVGTRPACARVLLTGDAAGVVNPLQGEGIAQALGSGCAAAQAVLAGPSRAAERYTAHLAMTYAPYNTTTATAHATLLRHPRAVSAVGRLLTAPVVGASIAGGWSLYWNDLLDGAVPRGPRRVAATAARAGRLATSRSRTRRWLADALMPPPSR
jgi:geranylgeranyl reductase family protein